MKSVVKAGIDLHTDTHPTDRHTSFWTEILYLALNSAASPSNLVETLLSDQYLALRMLKLLNISLISV